MLKTKVGNLVDAFANNEINVMGHCCNAQGNMGSGIAREIADRFPSIVLVDKYWHQYAKQLLTIKHLFEIDNRAYLPYDLNNNPLSADFPYANDKYIFNLYGQEHFGNFGEQKERTGRNVNYVALASSFTRMRAALKVKHHFKKAKIGFPKYMGCFRAGGDWNIVEQLIEDAFFDCDVTIYELPTPETSYTYPKTKQSN